ncbi:MAG: hypothetical protein CVV32_11850 [Methanomicrobiales archaeon HGW-Methanomicrobiales-3]|jgi:hypothetical protein|nr:MAG: hypothetical protein CVV32_11850 [Methanomicrobiales archaeon HGW-Methanomicrobiales-3]
MIEPGVKEACPLGVPPPLGERGGHHRNSTKGCYVNDFFRAELFFYDFLKNRKCEMKGLNISQSIFQVSDHDEIY